VNLFTQIRLYFIRRKAKRLEQQILREQNFVLYCSSCRAVLNETQEPVEVGIGFYQYTCPSCKVGTTFDMISYPVPIVAADPMGILRSQIDSMTH
jgi:hypothetical protein